MGVQKLAEASEWASTWLSIVDVFLSFSIAFNHQVDVLNDVKVPLV